MMRPYELARFALHGLWRQKIRSLLTIAGVAVGASSLAFSLSLGVGLLRVITKEFESRPGFWEVSVTPGRPQPRGEVPPDQFAVPSSVAPERAERLRERLKKYEEARLPHRDAKPLVPEKLREIAQWNDVQFVRTFRHFPGRVRLNDRDEPTIFVSTNCDRPEIRYLLIAGRLPAETETREVLVPELLLYRLGLRSEEQFQAILGQSVTISLGGAADQRQRNFAESIAGNLAQSLTMAQGMALLKLLQDVPQLIDRSNLTEAEKAEVRKVFQAEKAKGARPHTISERFTIVGIYRDVTERDKDALNGLVRSNWHLQQGAILAGSQGAEPLFRRLHAGLLDDGRYDHATVSVRPHGDLPKIVADLEALGFQTNSSLTWFRNAKQEVTAIGVGLNVFSWVALIVAALGITNTLVTNVVERTREIGILKAIGATRRQIQTLFLIEGTLIGTLGGVVGVVIARLAAGPLDTIVREQIQQQMQGHTLHSTSVFEFPLWLTLTTFAAAAVTTTLAAIYPARRASRVEPIEALKAM
jgi:putative ABC transport system permease protein